MKRALLVLGIAFSFFVGYHGITAKAYYGQSPGQGYFSGGGNDLSGWEVLNVSCSGSGEYGPYNYNNGNSWCNAIPRDLNSAGELINFIQGRLANGVPNGSYGFSGGSYGDTRARTGAASIVHTMIGTPSGQRNRPPTAAQMNAWIDLVNDYAAAGRINWNTQAYTWSVNSLYQGTDNSPSPDDVTFFNQSRDGAAIVFTAPNGTTYAIRRECGNPMGGTSLPPLENYSVTGGTTVNNASPRPGQQVTFQHHITNNGPTAAPSEYYAAFDGPSSVPTGLSTAATGPNNMAPGATIFKNELFPIPNNAAANTKYCRLIGWDPINSAGARNGRGAEACATVYVPPKIKAVMTANPRSMAAGSTTQFTPGISVQSTGSSVTVNCTITRTQYIYGGATTSLGVLPCVTTAGDPNIVVSGSPVTLRANPYTSVETMPSGSRVCDVMTITNPVDPAFYANPATDMTATDCVYIIKTPYVTFMGGDVWAGGNFAAVAPACNTSAKITTVARQLSDGSLAGSGVEYNAFALNKITQFGSAGRALLNPGLGSYSLTFSNTDTSNLGFYGAGQHCIEDYIAKYGSATPMTPGTVSVSGQPSQIRHITGDATFHGAMPAGSQQIYVVDGNATIDQPITYSGSYANIGQIPSLVIISKGDIRVAANVDRLDGIYVERNTFYTCYPKTEPAVVSVCNLKLTAVGAVIAGTLDLFRTAGAEGATPAQRKDPAETFIYSTEAFLRNALSSSAQPTIKVSNLRELPSRF